MKKYVKSASYVELTDQQIKEAISKHVLHMQDHAAENAIRKILFSAENTINWQNAWEAVKYNMPEMIKYRPESVEGASAMKVANLQGDQVKDWYDPEYYPNWDPAVYTIKWNINAEDIECVAEDKGIDLSNVKSVRYFNDKEQAKAEDAGYEGGYVFTYNDGTRKKFAWKPYPRNLDPMDEIENVRGN